MQRKQTAAAHANGKQARAAAALAMTKDKAGVLRYAATGKKVYVPGQYDAPKAAKVAPAPKVTKGKLEPTVTATRVVFPDNASKAQLKAAARNPAYAGKSILRAASAASIDASAAKTAVAKAERTAPKVRTIAAAPAHGAVDGQPHTKVAVRQARAAERANGKAQPAPKADAKPAKAKPAPKANGHDRAYKVGPNSYAPKAGSWTEYMVATILAHTSTDAAKAAHAAGHAKAKMPGKPLDFNWCAAKGIIAWK